jgi:hypothetical protein
MTNEKFWNMRITVPKKYHTLFKEALRVLDLKKEEFFIEMLIEYTRTHTATEPFYRECLKLPNQRTLDDVIKNEKLQD